MLAKAAEPEAAEVGGERAHRVVADLHAVASSPEEQPSQLTVTKQGVCAKVPGGEKQCNTSPAHA